MDLVASTEFLVKANSAPKDLKAKIIKVLSLLAVDPKHPSLHFKRVRGAETGIFECRIDQKYRMIVSKHKGLLRCLYLDNHDAAIRKARSMGVEGLGVIVEEIMASDSPDEFWRFRIHAEWLEKTALAS